MLSRVVLPQPLGPTIAMNSPSFTDRETSDSATTSRASFSRQYNLETWSISNFAITSYLGEPGLLFKSQLRFAILFCFDRGAVKLFEEAVLHQALHVTIVDDFMKVVGL